MKRPWTKRTRFSWYATACGALMGCLALGVSGVVSAQPRERTAEMMQAYLPAQEVQIQQYIQPIEGDRFFVRTWAQLNGLVRTGETEATLGQQGLTFDRDPRALGENAPEHRDLFGLIGSTNSANLAELLRLPLLRHVLVEKSLSMPATTASSRERSYRHSLELSATATLLEDAVLPDGVLRSAGELLTYEELLWLEGLLLGRLYGGPPDEGDDDYHWKKIRVGFEIKLKGEGELNTGAVPGGGVLIGGDVTIKIDGRIGDWLHTREAVLRLVGQGIFEGSEALRAFRDLLVEELRKGTLDGLPLFVRESLKYLFLPEYNPFERFIEPSPEGQEPRQPR